jgi:CDP-diacylglycerol--serine O-phosphatidyltransferase
VILYILPFVTFACAFLMVSRMRYPHLFNRMFRGRKPLTYLYFAIFVAGMLFLCGLPLSLVLTFSFFALSGPARWLWVNASTVLFRRKSHLTESAHLPGQP